MPTQPFNVIQGELNPEQLSEELAKLQKLVRYIINGQLDFENIRVGGIVADNIDVAELSAISANLGTIIAGLLQAVTILSSTITGSLIQTSESSHPRVEVSTTDTLITAASTPTKHIKVHALDPTYGSPSLGFADGDYLSGIRQGGDTLVIGSPTGPMSLSANGLLNLIASGQMPAFSSGGSVSDIPSAINSKQNAFIGITGSVDPATVTNLIFSNGILVGYT